MQTATRHVPDESGEIRHASDGFVLAAIFCAALFVVMFALNGGPNLFGDRFDTSVIASTSR
jgi:hypothetical protein